MSTTDTSSTIPTRVGIRAARKAFRELLDRASRGERITITRHGRPVAQIGPAPRKSRGS